VRDKGVLTVFGRGTVTIKQYLGHQVLITLIFSGIYCFISIKIEKIGKLWGHEPRSGRQTAIRLRGQDSTGERNIKDVKERI
jgi:hypothetical protein